MFSTYIVYLASVGGKTNLKVYYRERRPLPLKNWKQRCLTLACEKFVVIAVVYIEMYTYKELYQATAIFLIWVYSVAGNYYRKTKLCLLLLLLSTYYFNALF